MGFEPQKFFIGLMDFFTILLPGALLAFILKAAAGPAGLGDLGSGLTGAEGWAVFLFASYLLGHIVFLLASWLDKLYDRVRSSTLDQQIRMMAERDRLLPCCRRAAIWLIFQRDRNLEVKQAAQLRQAFFRELGMEVAINNFQWSKIFLGFKASPSLAHIERFEADSKFFRSFALVMMLLIPPLLILIFLSMPWQGIWYWLWQGTLYWPWQDIWPWSGLFLVVLLLFLLASWRYMEQRFKAIRYAYWSVITHVAQDGSFRLEPEQRSPGSPVMAGGVVFRARKGKVEYLFVDVPGRPGRWRLPMARIEKGEPLRETAIRGVHEEAGVWAAIRCLTTERQDEQAAAPARQQQRLGAEPGELTNGQPAPTRFFLMQAVGTGLGADRTRRHQWLALKAALDVAQDGETRDLLEAADARRESS